MRIAIISPGSFSVPPVIGSSVEHDIQMVASELAKENDVIVYTKVCVEYPTSTKIGNLVYKRFDFRYYQQYLAKVLYHIEHTKPDIILVENRPANVLRMKERIPDTPIVLNMHSMVFALPPHISSQGMKVVASKVNALITNSKYLRQDYVDKYPALAKKAHAIHLGIDPTPFEQARTQQAKVMAWKKRLGIQERDLVILFIGRLIPEKGLHLLLEVMPRLIRQHSKVKLIIAGSPRYGNSRVTPYLVSIQNEAKRLRNHVRFTGFIPPRQVPIMYQLANLVVIPSIWNEPFGRVNLEAMASGKAVVGTNRGGIPEVIIHGMNGWLFSPERYRLELFSSISRLLSDEKLRLTYGQMGLEMAKSYTWERTAHEYDKLFKALLDTK